MQQIADWLQKLSLGQYAQRFAENDITLTLHQKLPSDQHSAEGRSAEWDISES